MGKAPPCRDAESPPGAGFPPGGAYPAGAKTISFSAEKETVLDSKEKVRPVYGAFQGQNGGLRLYALFGDQPRPLRPCHGGIGTDCGSIWPPPGGATLAAECGMARRVHHTWHSPAPPQGRHLTTPAPREAPAGGGWLEPGAHPCSPTAGRNGRKGSPQSYESRWPPWTPKSLP